MLIIAHRGARSTHPENTLSAIKAALDMGCRAIEIDVHQHDGEFWVIHDRWLNRTTNGKGLLKWYSTQKLTRFDAGNGEQIPTLRQVLALIQGQCALNIEVKGLKDISLLNEHLEFAVQNNQFKPEQLILSSFNHSWLKKIKQAYPKWLIGALTASRCDKKAQFAQMLEARSINIDLDVVDETYVLDAKKRGLRVFVYTVNKAEDWHWLEQIGVDGVFCDCPAKAIALYPQAEKYDWLD